VAGACDRAERQAKPEIGGAIQAARLPSCVLVAADNDDVLSLWRMSLRASSYTRAQRQITSADNFPAGESRPRRGMASAS
jgi:hypothetical protein